MKQFFISLLLSMQLVAQEPLIVGTTSGYAPFVSLNERGEYEGFDIDFANELAKRLHRKLVIKDCGTMPNLLLALQQKKIDLAIWAVSITNERLKKMEMVYYQGKKMTEIPVLFWKSIPEEVQTIEDLRGLTIGVEAGSYQESILKNYPKIHLKQVEKISDALMEIRYGKSKAVVVDSALVEQLKRRFPKIRVLYLPLKVEECSLGNGVCLNRSNLALVKEVKKATQDLIQDGVVAQLEEKWQVE